MCAKLHTVPAQNPLGLAINLRLIANVGMECSIPGRDLKREEALTDILAARGGQT
jgi:hypothetical protein